MSSLYVVVTGIGKMLIHVTKSTGAMLTCGYRYRYNVETNMFSSGNITEKLRISKLDCTDEVVVDLYAGNGDCCYS